MTQKDAFGSGNWNTQCQRAAAAVLCISSVETDHTDLELILAASRWRLYRAESRREALSLLREHLISVVICEKDLPDGRWNDLLDELAGLPNPPVLIVASRLADDLLWAEVLNLGDHDVLLKPFDHREVCWSVATASREWRQSQQTAQPPRNTAPSPAISMMRAFPVRVSQMVRGHRAEPAATPDERGEDGS